jgi:Fic family protein
MDELSAAISAKKERLDALRPVSRAALIALQHSYDLELTYTSNAIEGNTLTLRETAELIEHGITVGGKPLRDHLEAVDHHAAVLRERRGARTTLDLPQAAYEAPQKTASSSAVLSRECSLMPSRPASRGTVLQRWASYPHYP